MSTIPSTLQISVPFIRDPAPSFELISSVHLVDAVDIISDASLIQRNANPFVPRIVDLHFLFFLPLSRLLRNSPREEFRSQLERIFSRFGWSIRSSVIQTKMAAARQSFFFYRGERGVEGALAFDEKPIVFHGRAETWFVTLVPTVPGSDAAACRCVRISFIG